MILKKKFNKAGQAAVELAILGSLVLLGFSVILMYGQRLEMQQQIKMEAFRKALEKAYESNSSVSYAIKKDARFFNLFAGYGQGQSSTLGASANVMWQKGMAGPKESEPNDYQAFSYYEINDVMVGDPDTGLPRYYKQTVSYTGDEDTVRVPLNIWKEERARTEQYGSSVIKGEGTDGINNVKSSDLQDTAKTQLYWHFDYSSDEEPWDDETPLPIYAEGGESYADGDASGTVDPNPAQISQGAYYKEDINRIDYGEDKVGTTIHRERSWQTGQ